ncbi:hypothetical protein pclt_cds_925 [Pandoravirus celtis]|uniref:Ankyrin repeat domain containing protein n=1 Tax=Pandoravirus celtis TaxID=2568002 RepID=A0A4D6EI66_9VIRU|nr:hypothetical protein pclt_cds_925 [Pandoravirus celtis]
MDPRRITVPTRDQDMSTTTTPMELDDMPCDRATSLADVPVEILLAIAQQLADMSVRDLVAWSVAIGLDLPTQLLGSAVEDAIPRFTVRTYHSATRRIAKFGDVTREVVAAGAPLCVVQYIARHDRSTELVVAAANGGCIDVLDWAWSHARPDQDVWYGKGGRDSWSGFSDALKGAVRRNRRQVLIWLLERKLKDQVRVWHPHDGVMTLALDEGYADVADAVHRVERAQSKMHDFWKSCFCGCDILDDAVRRGRDDVLDILEQVGCHLVSTINHCHLAKAVRKGHVDLARWIAARLDAPTVSQRDMGKAAARGHVSVVAFVHDTGLATCTADTIERAVIGGRTNVLDWAIGRGQAPPARPIAPWYGPHLTYAAAEFGRQDVLAWMARQPDIAPTLTVGVARRAVVTGHWPCAVVLHDHGIVGLDTWDALTVAVQYATLEGIKVLAEKGARCTTGAMCAALCHKTSDVLAYLCERFGIGDLQAAVDAALGLTFGHESLAWVAANVRAVCVAQLAHQQRGMLNVTARTCCQCARCAP